MFKAHYKKYQLKFKRPSGTSRGVLTEKDTYYIFIERDNVKGLGECSTIIDLSIDHVPGYKDKLREVCSNIEEYVYNPYQKLSGWPSIAFGVETALKDLEGSGKMMLFPSLFADGKSGIYINGLIWMGSFDFMKEQLNAKLDEGYKCIKIKIGGIKFEEELHLLSQIRKDYPGIELRLDANGAFKQEEALHKLEQLSVFNIHSIEQPIKQGAWEKMAELCRVSPIPIALDEELIGINELNKKKELVSTIKPQYLILKPSLLGGFQSCEEWIDSATENNIGWWATSALESNVGLNAIAQWVAGLASLPSKGGFHEQYGYQTADPILYGLMKEFVKKHRSQPTEAEKVFWSLVKGKKLDGYKFRRQHIIGGYIADFVCLHSNLIVEIDGLIHQLPDHKENDEYRTVFFNKMGFNVIRISNEEVIGSPDTVCDKVLNALKKQTAVAPPLGGMEGLPQGLGTGQLYTNNIDSPLVIKDSRLWHEGNYWNLSAILNG